MRGGRVKPRVLFVGRAPLPAAALARASRGSGTRSREVLDVRVARGAAGVGDGGRAFRARAPLRPTALDGPRFYAALPARSRASRAAFRPDAIVAQSPYEAAGRARSLRHAACR